MKYLAFAAAVALQLSSPMPAHAASCEYPDKDVKVLVAQPPDISEAYLKKTKLTGETLVQVGVDPHGKVIKTVFAKRSGDATFDKAVMAAARASTYAPATRNCVGVRGTYLFQAQAAPAQP